MNHYNESAELLETGVELMSPHLRWLIKNAAIDHCGEEALDIIAYHCDLPTDSWAESVKIVKGIAINLEKHFYEVFELIDDENTRHLSFRCLLLRELLDTTIHEAHHLKVYHENKTMTKDEEEAEAKKISEQKAWLVGKTMDVNIQSFGPIIDPLLNDIMTALKTDMTEQSEEWKKIQLYMWENNLGFFDSSTGIEMSMFKTFESNAKDVVAWTKTPTKFLGEDVTQTPIVPIMPTPIVQQAQPVQSVPQQHTQIIQQQAPQVPSNSIDFSEMDNQNYDTPNYTPPTNQYIPVQQPIQQPVQQPIQQPIQQPVQQSTTELSEQEILIAVEQVLRTLFWHVMTKCDFNSVGGYNNPSAVLEPISIAHIPNATKIFTNMDTTDEYGATAEGIPCNGMIKGKITKENLPMYSLYLKMGKGLHQRSLSAQNPNKLSNKNVLTTWAAAARSGTKLMSFHNKEVGTRASIKLEANKPLGQEEFILWPKQKS